jgi:cytochrome c biogenesis protein
VQEKAVSVNDPLRVAGATVYLVGHGYAPHLRIRDGKGRVVWDDTVVFLPQDGNFTSTGVVKLPDSSPALGLMGIFTPTAAISEERGPHSTFPAPDDPALFLSAFSGDLGLDSGQPSNVYELDTTGLDRLGITGMQPGDVWDLPKGAGSVEFVSVGRYASFSIAHDPGKLIALLGAVTAIIAVTISLFVRRRRIWVRVEGPLAMASPGRPAAAYRVQVAGLARGSEPGIDLEVQDLVAQIGGPNPKEGP